MTKQTILEDITSRVIKIISETKSEDKVKEAVGITSYDLNVFIEENGRAVSRNIGIYVVDEGEESEKAYYRDVLNGGFFSKLAKEYARSLVPSEFIRVSSLVTHEDNEYADGIGFRLSSDDKIDRVKIIIYTYPNGEMIHKEVI